MSATKPTHLQELAARLGILPGYVDNRGNPVETSDEARIALLAAMGIEASTEAGAIRAQNELEEEARRRPIAPVQVRRQDDEGDWRLKVRVPSERRGRVDYRVELTAEDGSTEEFAGQGVTRRGAESIGLRLPVEARPGYHRLRLELGDADPVESLLIVAPERCPALRGPAGAGRRFGIWHHLYSVRSRRNWGAGDLGDLRRMVEWSASVGAAFVGLNPLHALRNRGQDISPYSPVSRLYRNELYVDVEAVPEWAECEEARALLSSPEQRSALSRARAAKHVLYDEVSGLKRPALDLLHAEFARRHRGAATERGRAYESYVERGGRTLIDFATYLALDEHFRSQGIEDWREWPTPYRDPGSATVERFRTERREAVDRQAWVQFELERQLESAAAAARRAGMEIGLYGDLAIGSAPNSCDAWAFPGQFLAGASIGAPPDDYSPEGQDWGLPPLDPQRLRADGYRYWILLVRGALRHVGALRIDHAMGLLRQYWVPQGEAATQGAYIRYPARDLLAVVALESQRAGALVVGEDLGTVPRGFPALLARWGILSSSVLYFERNANGGFRSASRYSPRALATADTHDHPPLLGFWSGRDLELRHDAGELRAAGALEAARADRRRDREALERRLRREGCLETTMPEDAYPALPGAVHSFLGRTAAPLVAASLDDLCGETEPLNLPGVTLDRYPSWSRRQSRPLEDLAGDDAVAAALGELRPAAARPPGS